MQKNRRFLVALGVCLDLIWIAGVWLTGWHSTGYLPYIALSIVVVMSYLAQQPSLAEQRQTKLILFQIIPNLLVVVSLLLIVFDGATGTWPLLIDTRLSIAIFTIMGLILIIDLMILVKQILVAYQQTRH